MLTVGRTPGGKISYYGPSSSISTERTRRVGRQERPRQQGAEISASGHHELH
jgi:hypothetical protein